MSARLVIIIKNLATLIEVILISFDNLNYNSKYFDNTINVNISTNISVTGPRPTAFSINLRKHFGEENDTFTNN